MTRRALRCVRAVSRAVEGLSALLATLEERLVEHVSDLDVYSAPEAARAAEEMREAWERKLESDEDWAIPNLVMARACSRCSKPTHWISDHGNCASCALRAIS